MFEWKRAVMRGASARESHREKGGTLGEVGEESSRQVNPRRTHLLHGNVLDVSATEDYVIVDLRAGRDLRAILLAPFGTERSHCERREERGR